MAVSLRIFMLGLSRVESLVRPLRRMVARRADVYRVQSSSLRTGVKEIVTRFVRGQSYLNIGWNWVKLALSWGYELLTSLHLSAEADPAPAMASKIQHQKQPQLFSTVEFRDAA